MRSLSSSIMAVVLVLVFVPAAHAQAQGKRLSDIAGQTALKKSKDGKAVISNANVSMVSASALRGGPYQECLASSLPYLEEELSDALDRLVDPRTFAEHFWREDFRSQCQTIIDAASGVRCKPAEAWQSSPHSELTDAIAVCVDAAQSILSFDDGGELRRLAAYAEPLLKSAKARLKQAVAELSKDVITPEVDQERLVAEAMVDDLCTDTNPPGQAVADCVRRQLEAFDAMQRRTRHMGWTGSRMLNSIRVSCIQVQADFVQRNQCEADAMYRVSH